MSTGAPRGQTARSVRRRSSASSAARLRRRHPPTTSSRTSGTTAERWRSRRSDTLGGQDVYVATRDSTADPWSPPINVGAAVNTGAGETRPSLSRHGEQLLFGRAGPVGTGEGGTGASDIYVTTRRKGK